MRYETIETTNYSLELHREARFRLTYEVTEEPKDGTTHWFLVKLELMDK